MNSDSLLFLQYGYLEVEASSTAAYWNEKWTTGKYPYWHATYRKAADLIITASRAKQSVTHWQITGRWDMLPL